MNRRDFLRIAGLGLLGIVLPKSAQAQIGVEEMELGDLLAKVANNARLTPDELSNLKRMGNETQQRNSFLAGNITPANELKIKSPIEILFSEVLEADNASLTINIPAEYKHIWIIGGGRTTDAGTSAVYFLFQLSGDTGNNYINEKFSAVSTVLTGSRDTSQPNGIVGLLAEADRQAGDVCSFSTLIPLASSANLNKNSLTLASPAYGSFFGLASNWDSVSPVTTIKLYPAAGSIAAGSYISVYGLR